MSERRLIHADPRNRISTVEDAEGVWIMRFDELNAVPSAVRIPWEALAGLSLDLKSRIGDRRRT